MIPELNERLKEIATELWDNVQRPDIYLFVVVDADDSGPNNTRVMSNLSQDNLEAFLLEVYNNIKKPGGNA